MSVLFMTRVPPDSNGYGASQRAMHLLQSLAKLGPVDLLVVYHRGSKEFTGPEILDAARPFSRSCAMMELVEWAPAMIRWPRLSWKANLVVESLTPYHAEAPRLPGRTLHRLAALLPQRHYDLVFAGRLPAAVIAEAMIGHRLITAFRKVVDLDDVMSEFKQRQLSAYGQEQGRFWRSTQRIDIGRVRKAEARVLKHWDAVSVCSADDVDLLGKHAGKADIIRVPNVVSKQALPARAVGPQRILFVGLLMFPPNVLGLRRFLAEAWPRIRDAVPGVELDVVGMRPVPELAEDIAAAAGVSLHADVPSVEPFYRACDAVIVPIEFGGGTRIKILEAMAYHRPIVSTTIGAEGLGIEPDRHALIADDITGFADAVIRLVNDAGLRSSLADAAGALQRDRFGPAAMERAVRAMALGAPQQAPAQLS